MDILLTHGYFLALDAHEQKIMKPYPPLGLLYLSSYLKSKGIKAEIFDSTFKTPEQATAYLENNRPEMVGIYSNLMTKPNVLKLIKDCKRLGALVILGGPDPPFYVEEYLKYGADIVVTGEGEETLAELVSHLQQYRMENLSGIGGIAFMADGSNVEKTPARPFIADLDQLPMPDRKAIDMAAYLDTWKTHHDTSAVSLICARGCPYTCTWCSHSVYGFSHRRRSPQNVADEVEWIQKEYRPDMLWYADDVFTIHFKWLYEYAEELKRRELRIPFECIAREDRLNEKVVKTLAEMGCFRVWIGAESGSQKILDAMQRKTDAARVQEVTRLVQDYGIEAGMFIMLGYENETEADLRETAAHLKKSNPDIFLTTVAYPIKGTKYYNRIQEKVFSEKTWANGTDRDLEVRGRHSKRYYDFANRWLVNEVNLHKMMLNGNSIFRKSKAYVNANIGRLGMRLTKHERT